MAGKKGIHGGVRPGSGRKTKAEELGLPCLIHEVIGDAGKKNLIQILYNKAKAGSYPHHQLLMYYTFGKPKEQIDVTTKGAPINMTPIEFVRTIKKIKT